jgi:hypothetical protein
MTIITISDADLVALGGTVPRSGRLQVWRLTAPVGQAELDRVKVAELGMRNTSFEVDPAGALAHVLDAAKVPGLTSEAWTVIIPVTSSISLSTLIGEHSIDDGSFPPGPTPPPAWSEVLGQVTEQATIASGAAGDASGAATDAEQARLGALGYRTESKDARDESVAARNTAEGAAGTATGAAGTATTKAAEAVTAASVAGAAAGAAVAPVATDLAALKVALPNTYVTPDAQSTALLPKLDKTTAAATYSPLGIAQPMGVMVAYFGDSIPGFGEGYGYWVAALSSQRLQTAAVKSHPGATSAALIPFISEITSLAAGVNVFMQGSGTNDAGANVPVATFMTNRKTIDDAMKSFAKIVVLTVPPLSASAGTGRGLVGRYNAALRRYAKINNYPLVDIYAILADPATGDMKTAYDSGDHKHPSTAGLVAMATEIVRVVGALAAPVATYMGYAEGGPNLQPNAMALADANADGLANSFSATPTTGVAWALITGADGVRRQRVNFTSKTGLHNVSGRGLSVGSETTTLAASASAGAVTLSLAASVPVGSYVMENSAGLQELVSITAISGSGPYTATLSGAYPLVNAFASGTVLRRPLSVGDRIQVLARVSSGQDGGLLSPQLTCYNAGQASVVANLILTSPQGGFSKQVTDVLVAGEIVIPSTAVTAVFMFGVTGTGAASEWWDFAAPTVLNLTRIESS